MGKHTTYGHRGREEGGVSEPTSYVGEASQQVPPSAPYMGICGPRKEGAKETTPHAGGAKQGDPAKTPYMSACGREELGVLRHPLMQMPIVPNG